MPDAPTQRIDFISDYVETMLGYTVEEWFGTPNFWLSIVHPEDRERMARVASENFLKSQSYTEEFRWVTKDGRSIWVETHSTIICDKAGQPIGYRGVNIDITERKLAERLIKESEERYRIVAETANDMIITIDEHASILFVNQAAEKVIGYKPKELIGNNLSIIVPERL
jgi:PAS domain S-box-containing protein